jgi:hypothetical protein
MATMTPSFLDSIYTYETLEGQPEGTIRVLTINPGDANLISCSLSNVQLNNNPSYKALSYVWGDKHCTKTIMIDGKSFPVRPNLWAFLDRFQRYHGTTACIWIDAICVNQDDIPERNDQVLLMSKIYTQAAAVYSWLDLGTEWQPQMPAWPEIMELVELGQTKFRARLMARKDIRTAVSAACQTVTRLVSNVYWERAWIVQEVLLGQQVFLWYGSAGELSLDNFARIYTFFVMLRRSEQYRDKPLLADLGEAFEKRHYLNRFLKFRYKEPIEGNYDRRTGRESLRDLLEETSTTLCSDVRDRIYAFLNLASDSDRYGITPDYGKPPADLFYDLMIAANNLDQLSARIFRGPDYTRLYSDSFFASRLGINLHLTYADLFASSQPKALDESALKIPNAYSELKADLAWVIHAEGVEARHFPVILVGPILDMNSSPDNWKGIAKQSVELVLASLTAKLREPKLTLRQNSTFHKLLYRLETEDVFVTFCKEAPVSLYHLVHAKEPLPGTCMQQKVSASSKPQGIAKYILDQVLVNENYTLMKNWNETVQRSFPTRSLVQQWMDPRSSTQYEQNPSTMLEKWQRKISRLVHGPQHSNSKARA